MKKNIFFILIFLILLFFLFFKDSIIFAILNIDPFEIGINLTYSICFITDLIYLIAIILCYKKTLIKDFKLFKKNLATNLENAFKYWLLGFIVMIIGNIIILFFTKQGLAQNEENVRILIKQLPLYMIFSVSIYAPITEELIFRKSIKDFISNKYLYILTSGLIFGGLHVISYINSIADAIYLIPYCALGFAFAYSYYKSNNIYSTIIMHCMHNTIAIAIQLIGSV